MTATPETTTTTDAQHHFLTGLAQQGRYAHEFARAGQKEEALEHCAAIERLTAAYREAVQPSTPDTLAQWLHWRFGKHGQTWDSLGTDDQSYWEHQAAAVRRAVTRGGFKSSGTDAATAQDGSA